MTNRAGLLWAIALFVAAVFAAAFWTGAAAAQELEIDLSETPIPFLKSEDLPPRVGALIELGRGINEVGELAPGIELPGGAVLQPALWIYGTTRTALLIADRPNPQAPGTPGPGGQRTEVITRLDLFANLQLTGTERIFAHVRPLDGGLNPAVQTGRVFSAPMEESEYTQSHIDWDIESLFFEGDFDEFFPNMDPNDSKNLDVGVAVGRFPVEFQNGYMVRDEMTAVGLSKHLVQFPGSSGMRIMGIWAFDHVNKPDNQTRGPENRAGDVDLFALSAETDFPWGLLELDAGVTRSNISARGDQFNVGIGWTGHINGRNYSVHANVSRQSDRMPTRDPDTDEILAANPNSDGELLVLGYSDEINLNRDIVFANVFWASGTFNRLASNATPTLGPVGLSFAGTGMGGYRPALSPLASDAVGATVGFQKFLGDELTNIAVELAHREDLEKNSLPGDTSGTAVTTRIQRKFANRFLVQGDAYYAKYAQAATNGDDEAAVLRIELRMNF